MEVINVKEAKECVSANYPNDPLLKHIVLNVLDQLPKTEAKIVVHAEWVPVPSSDMMTGKAYICSNCKKMRYGSYHPNYCQCCGAEMSGGNVDG